MTHRWFVAQTKPNAEQAARRRLARQDFACHVPMVTRRRTYRGKYSWHVEPLFRGYVFVLLDPDAADERWKRVNSTRAILHLLPASDAPLPLEHNTEIEELHEAELAGNFILPRHIKPGSRLKPTRGTLTDRVMECLDCDDRRGVLRALWDCMGAKRVVTLSLDDVLLLA